MVITTLTIISPCITCKFVFLVKVNKVLTFARKTKKPKFEIHVRGLVMKETVVLRRWRVEMNV